MSGKVFNSGYFSFSDPVSDWTFRMFEFLLALDSPFDLQKITYTATQQQLYILSVLPFQMVH